MFVPSVGDSVCVAGVEEIVFIWCGGDNVLGLKGIVIMLGIVGTVRVGCKSDSIR